MERVAKPSSIRLKRAYDPASANEGTRILIDRLWPRGLRKSDAAIDAWYKEIAPSTELRQWFHLDPSRWDEFRRRYEAELSRNAELLSELQSIARRGTLTLIYSARDEMHNQAVVLRDAISRVKRASRPEGSGGTGTRIAKARVGPN